MWKRAVFVCLGAASSAFAQEGHPLTGTFSGDWGSAAGPRNHVTLVMKWDGQNVTGIVNPGPNSAPLNVSVDYATWVVRIQAETKDATGRPVRIEAEGKLEEMGSARRRLVGTWRQGETSGNFRVIREQ